MGRRIHYRISGGRRALAGSGLGLGLTALTIFTLQHAPAWTRTFAPTSVAYQGLPGTIVVTLDRSLAGCRWQQSDGSIEGVGASAQIAECGDGTAVPAAGAAGQTVPIRFRVLVTP